MVTAIGMRRVALRGDMCRACRSLSNGVSCRFQIKTNAFSKGCHSTSKQRQRCGNASAIFIDESEYARREMVQPIPRTPRTMMQRPCGRLWESR